MSSIDGIELTEEEVELAKSMALEGYFEEDEEDRENHSVKEMQKMINSGLCWKMEGSVGRSAMACIESGDCILGKVGHKDYWGNYVPSRFEVQSGTKGSIAYRKAIQNQ